MAKGALSPPSKAGSRAKTRKASKRRSGRKGGARKGAARKGTRRKSARRSGARFGAIKSDLVKLGIFVGQVSGTSAIASAAAGYVGPEKVKLFGKVDARLVAAGVGAVAKLWGKLGSWDGFVTNATTGVLTSWLNEESYQYGAKMAAPAAAPAAAADVPAGGMVVGNIYDGVGDAEKRLERKLARLHRKADKKGVEWKDVRDMDKSKKAQKWRAANPLPDRDGDRDNDGIPDAQEARWAAAPGRRRVVPPWFLAARRRWRANHPRVRR